jgi:Mitochondrial carrier protein
VPAEILSAKLAIQDRKGAIGMNEMIAQIYRKEGIMGFFKGFFSSLAVHVTYSFLWWVSYSTTRRQVEIYFPNLQRDNLIFYDAITGKTFPLDFLFILPKLDLFIYLSNMFFSYLFHLSVCISLSLFCLFFSVIMRLHEWVGVYAGSI